jgi:ABC-type molybdate transport system substrate-binding protein
VKISPDVIALLLLVVSAAVSTTDLLRAQEETLVIYTTSALRQPLELVVAPWYEQATGVRVQPVYMNAGQQYTRLRLSGDRPEAAVFLHASPLYLEKGVEEGIFRSYRLDLPRPLNESLVGSRVNGGRVWYAFAWSPLVEIHPPGLPSPPDLARANVTFGLAHPRLSNNGVYNVAFFEAVAPEVGERAVRRTVVQPANARTAVTGVADGSFDVTLGYEAVARFFQRQGAQLEYGPIVVNGTEYTMPVLFAAGVAAGPRWQEAESFIRFLFHPQVQETLPRYNFRGAYDPPRPGVALPDSPDAGLVRVDWSQWRAIEERFPAYEARGGRYG